MGARIVLTTFGSFGDINPFIALGRGLVARGHEAVIATSPWYEPVIREQGLGFAPVRPDIDPDDRALIAKIMDARKGSQFLLRDFLLRNLDESLDDLLAAGAGADLMVTHVLPFAGPSAAELLGVRWVSAVLSPMSFLSVHDIPVFPEAPWMKRVVDGARLGGVLVPAMRVATRRWFRPIDDLRRRRGLGRTRHPLFTAVHSPTRVLALFSKVLARPQPDWPHEAVVTGAALFNAGADRPLDARLEAFLQAGPPPLVFTLGSSAVGAPGVFYEVAVEATGRLGQRAVLMLGPYPDNCPRGLPDSILAVEQAPHALLLPRAAAVIHQAGIGTTHQALRAGRAQLVVPYANDQPDNAHRVAALGVGRVIPAARFRADRAVRELGIVLSSADFASRAAAVGAIVAAEDGVGRACDEVEMALADG